MSYFPARTVRQLAVALVCSNVHCALGGSADPMLLLAVWINDQPHHEVVSARRLADGTLAVTAQALRSWRLKPASVQAALQQGGHASYVRLADIEGLSYHVDDITQTLALQIQPSAFEHTSVGGHAVGADRQVLTPTLPGGFFNYDLYWQRNGDRESWGGLFEAGLFNAYGSGTMTGLWRDDARRQWVRLDTTWNVDMPARMQSLRLGDGISRAGSWGRSVRFGGVQWTSNFATQPGFIPFPLPALRGEAAVASTLDVYLDNARLLQGSVPAGPFDLSDVPVVTGQGELRVVVRDLLGRQSVISQPYYASPRLLKPGLRDFSYELGAIRKDYGWATARYGRLMAVATERLGMRSGFTRELRAEILDEQQTVGAGGAWLMPRVGTHPLGTLNVGMSASRGPDGTGSALSVGAERQGRSISFNLQAKRATRHFVQLGELLGASPRSTVTAGMSLPIGDGGFGASFTRHTTWQGDRHRLVTANYSRRIGRVGQIGIYALQSFAPDRQLTVGVMLTFSLDARTSLSSEFVRQDGEARNTVQVQRSLPAGNGWGFRALAGSDDHYLASVAVQTDRGTFSVEGADRFGQTGYRAGASGGIAFAGGGIFPSRRIDDSFAVVKVGDFANVRIYRENQEVARTDDNGLALVTRLRAYQRNTLGIEQRDLPIEAEIDVLELKLAPALRSGIFAAFPTRPGRGASLRLIDERGQPLPPGMVAWVDGSALTYPIGFDGRVFAAGLDADTPLHAGWTAGEPRCSVRIPLNHSIEPLAELGTFTCRRPTH